MIFAVLSLGALAALFSALCIVIIGFLIQFFLDPFSVKRKVLSAYRFLVVMVVIALVYLIYDAQNDGMCDGMVHYVVTGYFITAVIISVLWRIIGYYFSEERE
ncbi:hypothetical protein [Corynebacterium sp. NML130628]|uniref:hypothetical protein n=1 Tax=Corynebacterium sp. NML130628 TaxID=1906333 RepID=UPI0008FB9757|nr:hypothetical protein [Corynebacterium sp. NML130628]OIR46440.1 hypothetical protein BJP07_00350 [Corynebacterium sp. NML130628]